MARRKTRARSSSLFLKFAVVFLLISIAGVTAMGFMYSSNNTVEANNDNSNEEMQTIVDTGVIYNNIFINDVHVGGLTKQQAIDKLNERFLPELESKEISFIYNNNSTVFKYAEFNTVYDYSEAVDEAYRYAREGSITDRFGKISKLEDTAYKIAYEPVYTYDSRRIADKLAPIAESVYIQPVDATITRRDGQFFINKGEAGRRLDTEKAVADINELLASIQEGAVEGVIEELKPQYTDKDFEQAQSLIGTYSTTFTGGDSSRNTNIKTAASRINDIVVYPDEVFSTNAAFGPSTYENGYRVAPVIIGGRLSEELGGGVCQVSSALYNALLFAELDIVERQNHSLKVAYMDYGFDATLAGDYIDLKFKNSTKYPVFVESVIEGNKLTVNIYGYEEHSPNRRLVFKNELVETVPPGEEKVLEDPTLPLGERLVVHEARTGYKYNVFKTVFENDVEIERVKINSSYYRPAIAEIHIGTGENVENAAAEGDDGEQVNVEDNTIDSSQNGPVIDTEPIEQETDNQLPVISNPEEDDIQYSPDIW